MFHICECRDKKGNKTDRKTRNGQGIWLHTEVDEEGICVHCGHYAMAFKHIHYNDRGSVSPVYSLLMLYGKDINAEKKRLVGYGHQHM